MKPIPIFAAIAFLVAATPLLQAQPVASDTTDSDSLHISTEWTRKADIDGLPVRSVNEVAAFAPGVRRDLATGRLTARSRTQPELVLDGARLLGCCPLPFESIQRIRVLTEGVPARYGQAASGLVLIETDPREQVFGGRIEGYSSRATDPYGADLGVLS
ncbi:MAG: hypothetical protein AAF170_07905, partial [Bacteroidota bacterium]